MGGPNEKRVDIQTWGRLIGQGLLEDEEQANKLKRRSREVLP